MPMGVIADSRSVPAGSWTRILDRVTEAGVRVEGHGEEEGLLWCSCRRGWASVGLALDLSKSPNAVYLYCGVLRYLSRPMSTRRLFAEVRSVITSTVGRADA
jgi:hypothetical protein